MKLLFLKTNTESEDKSIFLLFSNLPTSVSSLLRFINSPDLTPHNLTSEIHESSFKQLSNFCFQLFINLLASLLFNPPPCANLFLKDKNEVSGVPGFSEPYIKSVRGPLINSYISGTNNSDLFL